MVGFKREELGPTEPAARKARVRDTCAQLESSLLFLFIHLEIGHHYATLIDLDLSTEIKTRLALNSRELPASASGVRIKGGVGTQHLSGNFRESRPLP